MERLLKALGAVAVVGSCIPMLAVLPAAVTTSSGVIGIKTTSGPFEPLAKVVAPVARPLLAVGIALLIFTALRCSLTPVALTVLGGALFYASMYVFPDQTAHHSGMTGWGE
jgi:hypothetical protein